MLDFIRCPECGHPIGGIYEAFKIIKTIRYAKELKRNESDIDIRNTGVIDYIQISMSDIFDQLHIKNYCCRQHLTTCMDFHEAQYQ